MAGDVSPSWEWAGLEPLRLIELDAPLRPVTFPNGRTVAVVPFDEAAYKLEADARAGNVAAGLTLLRRCVPDATDEDILALAPADARNIVRHARRQLEVVLAEVERRRGKSEAEPPIPLAAVRPSPPSSRSTASAPWWRVWRRGKAAPTG